jgi:organic hydroperoxide reductase OsmC/OhrA
MKEHTYEITMMWTGNDGEGTKTYRGYRRDHVINAEGKPTLPGSSDPHFRGNPTRYNPEELLVASLSSCHMLWYLHLCAVNNIVVVAYTDHAKGWMDERENGAGAFTRVLLKPRVTILSGSNRELAQQLHHDAHDFCFIANSVKFPVETEADIAIAQ